MLPDNPNKKIVYDKNELNSIVLAGGCFWGTQAYISRLSGVAHTRCGYANGHTEFPNYESVCTGKTGHAEAVHVKYDPGLLPLNKLLHEYFKTINPTSLNRQGGDVGSQYRTGIYYVDESDIPIINEVMDEKQRNTAKPIVTEVFPLSCFYEAEEYHQDYLEKNPNGYCHVNLNLLPREDRNEQ